jgi:hypothetical protein
VEADESGRQAAGLASLPTACCADWLLLIKTIVGFIVINRRHDTACTETGGERTSNKDGTREQTPTKARA